MNYDYALFIPYEDITNKCAILVNNDYFYVYNIENNEISTDYDIVYFNNYYKIKGKEVNNVLVTDCYPYITNDFYYRHDLTNILINVLIISLFGILLPTYIFTYFFKRFR